MNADSTSVAGVEVGEAHGDEGEASRVTAHLMRVAAAALRERSEPS